MSAKAVATAVFFVLAAVLLSSCGSKEKADPAAAAPPETKVIEQPDLNVIKVEKPERFTLVSAEEHEEKPEIHVTGVVNPNIEKSVPVISLASGRVVGIYAKLGDDVRKGQLLLKIVSNDIANGIQTYQQAKADQELSRKQLERSRLLYEHGAISLNDLQVAESTYQKSEVAVTVAAKILSTLGADIDRPDPVVNIVAPANGTLVEQNVVAASIVHTPDNQTNLFTVADLSTVWIICNVYENDLPNVRIGDAADIRLNAYPDRVFRGRVNNIGKVLDTNIRTAPVRIVLSNPGMMRTGMFVTATLYGVHGGVLARVPSSAILHLHDRDWVFVPAGDGQFRRTEVVSGKSFEGNQEILSGLKPGQQVVRDALALSAESQQ